MDNENITLLCPEDPRELSRYIVAVLDRKKAGGIKLLHVEEQTIIADYFVICTGNSSTQLKSLADELEFKLSGFGIKPARIEGDASGGWLLLDFHSVIVHIFNSEKRSFYNIEKLYSDSSEVAVDDILTED